jgi:hypothetical protein
MLVPEFEVSLKEVKRNPLLEYVIELRKDNNKNTTYKCLTCSFVLVTVVKENQKE